MAPESPVGRAVGHRVRRPARPARPDRRDPAAYLRAVVDHAAPRGRDDSERHRRRHRHRRSGELSLPSDPGQVGWWQSGALAGDAFGSVVLAGHIDSKDRGSGFFARLLGVQPGDEVILATAAYQQRYRVVTTRDVPKASLATSTDTFSSTVPGRLVLLTCTGTWSPATHYPENLVVTAEPVGTPTPRG